MMSPLPLEEIRKANLFRVVYLGICFMVLFTSYFAGQNLMTQIYKQLGYNSLGAICFFFIIATFGLVSVLASHYYKMISARIGIIYGGAAYIGFIFAGALSTYCYKYESDTYFCSSVFLYPFNIITAMLLGAGSAFLWLCQSTYVNACADEETRGTYSGIFESIFQVSQILSGIIATIVLGYLDQFSFYVILVLFAVISVIMLSYIKHPVPYTDVKEAVLEDGKTLGESLKVFYNTLVDGKYRYLYTSIVFSGIAMSFCWSYLGTAVTMTVHSDDENIINSRTGVVFIVLAIGEILSGFTMGRFADKYDKIKLLAVCMLILEGGLLLTFFAMLLKNYSLAVICGGLWGYGDTAMATLLSVIIGSKFNASPQVFSVYRFLANVSGSMSIATTILVPKSTPMLLIMIIAGALLSCQALFYQNLKKEDQKNRKMHEREERLLIELKNLA